jgi:hypothetical protein
MPQRQIRTIIAAIHTQRTSPSFEIIVIDKAYEKADSMVVVSQYEWPAERVIYKGIRTTVDAQFSRRVLGFL